MNQRNFARGEPPPSHSHEWVGLAQAPTPAQVATARQVEAERANTGAAAPQPVLLSRTDSLTLVSVNPKPRRIWPWALTAGLAGYFWGRRR
jgi:hypothetical protein